MTTPKKPTLSGKKKPAPSSGGAGGTGARKAEMRTYARTNKNALQAAKVQAMTGDKSALQAFRSAQRTFVRNAKPTGGYKGATPVKLPPAQAGDAAYSRQAWKAYKSSTPKKKTGGKLPPPPKGY